MSEDYGLTVRISALDRCEEIYILRDGFKMCKDFNGRHQTGYFSGFRCPLLTCNIACRISIPWKNSLHP